MLQVHFGRPLYRFFPVLEQGPLEVRATTAAEVLAAVEAQVPGLRDYIIDERGALRPHVNIFIGDATLVDRKRLSDRVPEHGTVHILQALSGG